MMKTLQVTFIEKGEGLRWTERLNADTILERTDVPGIFKVVKSRYTHKVGKLIRIEDWT